MKKCYIMRGLPRSGKSTQARKLAGKSGAIHSTDRYFLKNGTFVFDGSKLEEFHKKNQWAFVASLKRGTPTVICDNTNISRREYEFYERMAKRFGYEVEIIVMPTIDTETFLARNSINVPLHTFERMRARFEP